MQPVRPSVFLETNLTPSLFALSKIIRYKEQFSQYVMIKELSVFLLDEKMDECPH